MKESDPCSRFGQSGLRFMFLLAKAKRFLIRVTISNLRNGISLSILSVVKVWNLNNDFRYNALLSKGIYHISVFNCWTYAPRVSMIHCAPSIFLLCRFKVLQNTTWFGLTGLKGNVMRVLCIDVINIILKTRASCFIRVFKHREIAFTVSRCSEFY